MADSLVEWLGALSAATAHSQARPSAEAPPVARPLRLFSDGVPIATVIVDADAVWFIPATPPATRTTLAPDTAAALQRSLDIAAP